MSIFRRVFVKCFYCKTKVDGKKAFTLQYTAADGMGNVQLCEDCSKDLNQLADNVEEVYDEPRRI